MAYTVKRKRETATNCNVCQRLAYNFLLWRFVNRQISKLCFSLSKLLSSRIKSLLPCTLTFPNLRNFRGLSSNLFTLRISCTVKFIYVSFESFKKKPSFMTNLMKLRSCIHIWTSRVFKVYALSYFHMIRTWWLISLNENFSLVQIELNFTKQGGRGSVS